MLDWQISLGNVITDIIALFGFMGTIIFTAVKVSALFEKMNGQTSLLAQQLAAMDKRITAIEAAETQMVNVLVAIAEQKAEIRQLGDRLADLQRYGSNRLSQILEEKFNRFTDEVKRG
jgi:hypothetical protein